ncbi:MAG: methyltransferase domain-containing protein [Candidatus Hodarchaeota archaeon]
MKIGFIGGCATGERLPYRDETTHIVIFNYSMCCIPTIENIKNSLAEAWRVLTPKGILVNFCPSFSQPYSLNLGNTTKQTVTNSLHDNTWSDGGFALKNSTLIEGKFTLIAEEKFVLKTDYTTKEEALEDILKGRQEVYRILDHVLNYTISKLICAFITNEEKPSWFSIDTDQYFTMSCQLYMKIFHSQYN